MNIFSLITVQDSTSKPTMTYKGIHFGKLTAKRMDFTGKEGPGPGEYEPYREPTVGQIEHQHIQSNQQQRTVMDAKLPRYHELISAQEEKRVRI